MRGVLLARGDDALDQLRQLREGLPLFVAVLPAVIDAFDAGDDVTKASLGMVT